MNSNKKTARVAGLLYLIVILTGVFANFFVRMSLIVPGDAATTANNIMASEFLFRIGFVTDLIMATFYILLALALYVLLKPVNKNLASLFVVFTLVSATIMMLNMLNHFAALLLLSGADYLTVFEEDQLHALMMLFLNLFENGYLIAQITFGLWLLPLGYLVFKSGYFPRILGVLLIIACFNHLIDLFIVFLFPSAFYEEIRFVVTLPMIIGEFSFCGWLLLKGAKISEMKS